MIQILAGLRRSNAAIPRGSYRTIYVDNDILIYERLDGAKVVLVAVNRGRAKTITLPGYIGFGQGDYSGLLGDASEANSHNYLSVSKRAWTVHLEPLSSLVVPKTVFRDYRDGVGCGAVIKLAEFRHKLIVAPVRVVRYALLQG